jgi:Gram-negative bacterial TonB protein C-terminal
MGLPAASIPQPQYPSEAKDRKLAGSIAVRVLINVRTSLVEKACTSDGNDILRKAAETAALKIRLFPYNDYIKERYRYAEGMIVYNFVAQ